MKPNDLIFVAGHRGMVGSAIVRRLRAAGFENLLLETRQVLDLRDRDAVRSFFESERPRFVFMAAAKVGGIVANDTWPVEFLRDNLAIELAVIDAAHETGVHKLLFLSSSCVYPKHAPQPMQEEHLLTGPLEPTNQWYAIAKIAGMKLCEAYRRQHGDDFISVLPTNLYGPHDNFDLRSSHVLPAMIRRFSDARASGADEVVLWGTGTPKREFMHVDDLADACIFLMENYSDVRPINVGVGHDLEIRELAEVVRVIVGFTGRIAWDPTRPDGSPRKLLDVSRLANLGWHPSISLEEGVRATWEWYVEHATDGLIRA
jgi:GDP-L-fucose synthase